MSDTAKRAAPEAKAEAEADQTAPEAGVKQGEPELVTEAPTAQDDGDHAKQDMDEMKRKFREALDRKNQAHAEGQSSGSQDTGKIHGAHGPAASRRNFRRKSGGDSTPPNAAPPFRARPPADPLVSRCVIPGHIHPE